MTASVVILLKGVGSVPAEYRSYLEKRSMTSKLLIASAVTAAAVAVPATANITITQGTSAPTYSSVLNFDEPGAPTGNNLPGDSWTAWGMAELVSGEGSNFVGDPVGNPALAWAAGDNIFYGTFGAYMTLDTDVTEFSMQYWDSSGPATFSGGGALVVALNDGVEVGSLFIDNPAWGGFGDSWFNIVATDGMVFDEVRALGFGFFPEAVVNNLSWNAVPTPGAGALMGIAGLATLRRRRA